MFLLGSQVANGQVSADERAALIALYQATNGHNWSNNSGWLGGEGTECGWHGVNCFDQTVVSIGLANNGLSGPLPPELTDLHSLRILHLRGNNISGGIPEWLGDLPSLEALDLGRNPLGGSVPGNLLSSSSLNHLWLDGCQIESLTDDVKADQSALTGLWLQDNIITEPLSESLMSALDQLVVLDISLNPMNGLPSPVVGTLPMLAYFNAGYIEATDNLSDWYSQVRAAAAGAPFPSLYYLNLQDNLLTGQVPARLFELSSLDTVWLDNNQLTGPLPETLFTNTSLQTVVLANNQLSGGLPNPSITEWPESTYPLLHVDLRFNSELSGLFPESLVFRTLLDRMETRFFGTALEFGDCFGLRQVSTLRPPLAYDPDEPVEVAIWMRNLDWPGNPRVRDAVPEHWEVVPDPDCYCVTEDPTTVHSAAAGIARNTVFRYYVQGPHDPLLAEAGQFDGILDSTHNFAGTRLICGDSRGWLETIHSDAFGTLQ